MNYVLALLRMRTIHRTDIDKVLDRNQIILANRLRPNELAQSIVLTRFV